jgi:hypothetical protein
VVHRVGLLAAIAAHRPWRGALIDDSARAAVSASIRAVWPHAPPVSWIDERGHVAVGGGTLRDGDDVSGRRAVGQAVRTMLGQIASQQALVDDTAAGYRELFELHPLPMWVVGEQTLRFLEINDTARRK